MPRMKSLLRRSPLSNEQEPLLPLVAGAAELHENMMAFVEVGFTRAESLEIVLTMLRETIKQNS